MIKAVPTENFRSRLKLLSKDKSIFPSDTINWRPCCNNGLTQANSTT